MKRIRILAATLFLVFLALPALAGQGNGKNFLIHAKTSLKLDDAQICTVPNVAWTALQEGYKVTVLFDASGVTALKKGGLLGGDKSPLDKAPLPERERQSLSGQLGMPMESVPHDYGEYIRFLKSKGVELYVNRTMTLLYKIGENEIDKAATPVGLKQMVEIFKSADVYVAYWWNRSNRFRMQHWPKGGDPLSARKENRGSRYAFSIVRETGTGFRTMSRTGDVRCTYVQSSSSFSRGASLLILQPRRMFRYPGRT